MVEVVVTVSTEVTAPVPDTAGVAGFKPQVAGLTAPAGPVTEQARFTLPVNPPAGVMVRVEVLPVVAPATRLSVVGAAERLKVGLTTTLSVVVAVVDPDEAAVPVMVAT